MSQSRRPTNGDPASRSSGARTPRARRSVRPGGPPGVRTSPPPFEPPASSSFQPRPPFEYKSPSRGALRRYGIPVAAVALTLVMVWGMFALDRAQPDSGLTPELEARIEQWEQTRGGGFDSGSPVVGGEGQTGLSVITFPTDAVVQIEFEPVGLTPLLEHELTAGTYFVSLTKAGYAPLDTLVFVDPGEMESLYATLRPLAGDELPPLPLEQPDLAILPEERPQRPDSRPTSPPPTRAEGPPARTEVPATRPATPPPASTQSTPSPSAPPPETASATSSSTASRPSEERPPPEAAPVSDREATRPLETARPAPPIVETTPVESSDPPTLQVSGVLEVGSEPRGAAVYLDGERVGRTPLTLRNLGVGNHEVTLQTEGYRSHRETVRVEPNQQARVYATLSVATGVLSVRVQPWGSIYVDGVLQRHNEDVEVQIPLPVGVHSLRVDHPTLGSVTREVTISEGSLERVVVDMNRQ